METRMKIGIPREIMLNERRVAATPDTVGKIVKLGFDVMIESGAGSGIFARDEQYAKAGATVVSSVVELFEKADVILKVKQPGLNRSTGKHEVEMMRPGSMLVTFLHPASPTSRECVERLVSRKITSFTMDSIPRTPRAQAMDALTSMSTITGYKSVISAAARLPIFVPMMGTAIGMLKPARVLVVGCGVVGLQAIATAKRLGAVVECADIRPEACEEGRSLGGKVVGFEVPPELARGEGGYALALPKEWLAREREALAPFVENADVVILSALVPGEVAPIIVTEKMVSKMRPGSVIVDVSIDQGGNCEQTRPGEETVVHDVLVSGVANIPGSVPVHATHLYATNMVNFVTNLFAGGPRKINWDDEIVRETLVTREGKLVHKGTLKALGGAGR